MTALSHFWGILFISLHAMVPITLAASGEVIGETAGLFNIGLEGIILLGALFGALGAEVGGPIVGLLTGMATGMAIGLIFGLIATYWKGDQLLTGIGINLIALGFVAFQLQILGVPGHHAVPRAVQVVSIRTPVGNLSPLILLTIILPFVSYYVLSRTQLGLKLKAVGENPGAADVAGIRVNLLRVLAAAVGASLAGLGGAFMSTDWIGSVTKEISAGRGFIALATVVFSGLNPLYVLLGGFIFGFFDSLATWISTFPGLKSIIPWQVISMAPYIVTLLVVAGAIGRARFPSAMGRPYIRE